MPSGSRLYSLRLWQFILAFRLMARSEQWLLSVERSVMDIFMQTVRRALRFLSGIILVASFIFGLKRGTWLVTFGTDRSELRNDAYCSCSSLLYQSLYWHLLFSGASRYIDQCEGCRSRRQTVTAPMQLQLRLRVFYFYEFTFIGHIDVLFYMYNVHACTNLRYNSDELYCTS